MNRINLPINKKIHERLREIDQLTIILEKILQAPLRDYAWPLLKYNQLIILTNNSQIASNTRFMQYEICKQVSQQLKRPIKKLNIKMISLDPLQQRIRFKNQSISQETADAVHSIADNIQDEALSQTLHRLMKAQTHD